MVNVDVCGRVDERSCRACEKSVVALAGEVEGDLLHVGCPVDFGVWEGVGLVVSSIMGCCSFFRKETGFPWDVCSEWARVGE